MKIFIALDVGFKATHVCVVDDEGAIVWRGVCVTDPEGVGVDVPADAPALEHAVLETGPLSASLYHGLIERGVPAVCICARHAKGVLSVRVNNSRRARRRGSGQTALAAARQAPAEAQNEQFR